MSRATIDKPTSQRLIFLDELRGFTILSMVLFHAAYDAAYIYGFDLSWFENPTIQSIWRSSISWVFLLLAGWMTAYSRSNIRRSIRYAICALLVFAATAIASVDTAVNFGILFCMACCTAIYAFIGKKVRSIPPIPGLIVALLLFFLTYSIPLSRYPVEGFAWLGFPSPTFSSGDYYPLVPYCFMYFAGAFAQSRFNKTFHDEPPAFMVETHCSILAKIGTRSLIIYLAHQPLVIMIFEIARLFAS